jgi:hypothetical protein
MKNDGKCWIHIPTDISDPTLTDAATQQINQLHQLLGKALVTAGQRNPYYDIITQIGTATGSSIDRTVPLACCGPISKLERIPLSLVALVTAVGGDVEGLPVFFELSTDPATTLCPFSSTGEMWSTWGTFGASHVPQQIGTKWYRSSAVGASGALMYASLWATVSPGNVKSLSEYLAIAQGA